MEVVFFFLMIRRPPRSTLFPSTTPFRTRLEIGPRDVAGGQVMTARRAGGGGKAPVKLGGLAQTVAAVLDEIQAALFTAARERREAHSVRGVSKQQFLEFKIGRAHV